MKLFVCKNCGVETLESHDGMCPLCYQTSQNNKELLESENQDVFKWVAKIAHMGHRRVIEVPKNQRSLINDEDEFIVTLERK